MVRVCLACHNVENGLLILRIMFSVAQVCKRGCISPGFASHIGLDHGWPFMLQELLPARERPLHRFQNSRTHPSHRHPNPRLRTLPGHQRRHVSNGRPPLPRASSGSGQPLASTSATLSDTAIQTFNHLSKTSLKDFDLSDAYETLRVICGDRNSLPRLN